MQGKIKALVVTASAQGLPLLAMLEACGVEVVQASDRHQARQLLQVQDPIQIVLTDQVLPDGTWRGVVEDVAQSRVNAEVVVCAQNADATLWCDVLESGAFDLLAEPYQRSEVQRIVEAAAAKSYTRSPAKPS